MMPNDVGTPGFTIKYASLYLRQVVWPSMVKHRLALILPVVAILVLEQFFTIGINATYSLPQSLFIVLKYDKNLHRGDYASFVWNGGGPYVAGSSFLKIVKGMPGDRVTVSNRNFFINGEFVGHAKVFSKNGMPLEPGPTGIIPHNAFYMMAPHRDSLDSRYALTGWIARDRILGRAIPLF